MIIPFIMKYAGGLKYLFKWKYWGTQLTPVNMKVGVRMKLNFSPFKEGGVGEIPS